MKGLLRGTDLVGLPVVTLTGDDVAEVRDVVFDAGHGQIVGFTLNKRSRLGRRLKEVLTREQISAVGPDAVMIPADVQLEAADFVEQTDGDSGGDVIADRVITDTGVVVGTVTDVVIDTGDGSIVGYEVVPADEPDQRKGRRSYLPLPETGAVSGEALIVPAAAVDYVSNDLAGFAEAVDSYRDALRGGSR
ncbi:MAG: PRC-barrel domain-containing protein [Acidimicrobiia bacterium]|nr:PRC-barrel domain-containing protein [Acidimicrobiia bacterium]MBA3803772.1 PRC-barrel domain-containing protein [Acidimicrobiia bacterium]